MGNIMSVGWVMSLLTSTGGSSQACGESVMPFLCVCVCVKGGELTRGVGVLDAISAALQCCFGLTKVDRATGRLLLCLCLLLEAL
jgi:hypothetical protein